MRYLIPRLFSLDLGAILNGEELLPLPDSLLEIEPYLDELERQRVETERRLQRERDIQESKRALEISRQRQAEEKARKQEELCELLGISPKALAKLQGVE